MTERRCRTRLGLKCTLVSFLALAVAAGVFLFLNYYVTTGVADMVINGPYWDRHAQKLVDSFQSYVTDNELTMDEARQDTAWKNAHRSVHFYLMHNSHISEDLDYYEREIRCADGVMYTYIVPRLTHFDNMGIAASLTAGILVFFLILIPYIVHLIRRITRLSREMDILTGGRLDYPIKSTGEDEITELGQSIEAMRLSVLDQIARESKAVSANNRLITSLSHDLRTPLTKLIGYLEILRYKRYGDPADEERYLDRALENALLLKTLSDKLFQSALVTDGAPSDGSGTVDGGSSLLNKLLSEFCFDLRSAGFTTDLPVIAEDVRLLIPEVDLRRILDNLFSNIKKYADPGQPVFLYYKRRSGSVAVGFSNNKKADVTGDSSGVGLVTVRQLMEQNGGDIDALEGDHRFVVLLRFPIQT